MFCVVLFYTGTYLFSFQTLEDCVRSLDSGTRCNYIPKIVIILLRWVRQGWTRKEPAVSECFLVDFWMLMKIKAAIFTP